MVTRSPLPTLTAVLILAATGPALAEAPHDLTPPLAQQPLAGWSDGTLFLRSPENLFYVHKSMDLDEDDITQASSGKLNPLGTGTLEGNAFYAQVRGWVIGDDTIVGRPGLQLPPRFETFAVARPRHGLQLLARVERLDETYTPTVAGLGNPSVGNLTLTSLQLGATYWYTKRFRAMFNYVLSNFGGNTDAVGKTVSGILGGSLTEHEFLFRLAIAL